MRTEIDEEEGESKDPNGRKTKIEQAIQFTSKATKQSPRMREKSKANKKTA